MRSPGSLLNLRCVSLGKSLHLSELQPAEVGLPSPLNGWMRYAEGGHRAMLVMVVKSFP